MRNKRVYSTVIGATVAAMGGLSANVFYISNHNRRFLLRSLYLDVRLFETLAPFVILPYEQNTTQEFGLTINADPVIGADLLTLPFQDFTIPGNIITNGTTFVMWKPGQVIFDSFFVQHRLQLTYNHVNRDLLLSMRFFASITVEIEDITLL